MKNKKVAVLIGGWPSEREVSLSTAREVIKSLEELGYSVTPIDVNGNLSQFVKQIDDAKPDIIYNALHGIGGEDGIIQGALEMLQIPYTHSGVAASVLAMNKILSRQIFSHQGIPVPLWKVISFEELEKSNPMDFPYVIKPVGEGSSRGINLVFEEKDRQRAIEQWNNGDQVLIEGYIKGREIHVSIIDGKAIGAIEIEVSSGYYDYEAKYTNGRAKHIMPAPLARETYERVLELSERAYHSLGCRSVCRADFLYDGAEFYLLELNTQPGMTPFSLVPETVAYYGMTFNDLVQKLVDNACCDYIPNGSRNLDPKMNLTCLECAKEPMRLLSA
jgi:D-alanine-D-alanine ligase